MPRELIPFATPDISSLAKSLRTQLIARSTSPTHVEMLNMLARALGHRNFQQWRSRSGAERRSEPTAPRAAPYADRTAVLRAMRYFDDRGRFVSWPARTSLQNLCLWVLWSKIPAERTFSEREINVLIGSMHLFGDHAILRRTMCDLGLMTRTSDGRDYRRVERPPTADGAALIRHVRDRASAS